MTELISKLFFASTRTPPFVFLYDDQEPRSWGGRSNAPPPPQQAVENPEAQQGAGLASMLMSYFALVLTYFMFDVHYYEKINLNRKAYLSYIHRRFQGKRAIPPRSKFKHLFEKCIYDFGPFKKK